MKETNVFFSAKCGILALIFFLAPLSARPLKKGSFAAVDTTANAFEKASEGAEKTYCSAMHAPEGTANFQGKEGWEDEKGQGVFEKNLSPLPTGVILKIIKISKVKGAKGTNIWYQVTTANAEAMVDGLSSNIRCHPKKFWVKATDMKAAPKKFKKAPKIQFENY